MADEDKGANVTVVLTGLSLAVSAGTATLQLFRPLPDDRPCYRIVGLIAAETARIERLLDQAICNLASLELRMGACITGQMVGPTPRFNALVQMAGERNLTPGLIKRIKTTSGRTSGIFDRRNRAVHDPWLYEEDSGTPYQFRGKPRTDPAFGPTPVSEQELKDTLGEIRKHRDIINELVSDIWTELRPASG